MTIKNSLHVEYILRFAAPALESTPRRRFAAAAPAPRRGAAPTERQDAMRASFAPAIPAVRTFATALPVALLLSLAGCGADPVAGPGTEPLFPVKGQVLLPGGKPLTSGTVVLLPSSGQSSSPRGELGPDGSFTLKTRGDREGAPAGQYKVRIEPSASQAAKKGGRYDPKSLPFPARYTDEDGNTGLTATVQTGPTTLEPFKLTAEAPAQGGSRNRD